MQYPVGSKLKLRFLGILLATSMAALCCTNAVAQSQNASRTNFVIILSDDMEVKSKPPISTRLQETDLGSPSFTTRHAVVRHEQVY
jgi:hypothetical protein